MSVVLLGSTSGSITLQEPAVAGTTVLDLPAVSGTILTTTSPKAGNVIQVVNATTTSQTATTSTSFVSTSLTASITPTSSTSKIFVVLNGMTTTTQNLTKVRITLYRNSTNLASGGTYGFSGLQSSISTGAYVWLPYGMSVLDSPSTTSSTTYTVYCQSSDGGQIYVNWGDYTSTITLLEIAG
jgi:hypothetical protein